VEDFLKPPAGGSGGGTARFRYRDRSAASRTFDWVLDGQEGKSIVLPDSDLNVLLEKATEFPTDTPETASLSQYLGDDPVPVAVFKIHAGKNEPVTHMSLGNLPMVPNVMPSADPSIKPSQAAALASIHYMVTPTLDPKINGRFGQIDVLAGPDQALYYRIFGRGKEGGKGALRASGRLETGKPVLAFGGGPNMPMTITFQVDSYLPAGIEKRIYQSVVLPKGQMDNGIGACRAEMTVNGQTKEIWLGRSENNLDPPSSRFLTFGDAVYEMIFDVDRRPLGFELKLDDFDTEFEPGTEQPTHFTSQVRLTDALAGIKDKPCTISMNSPLDYRGFTFYQSNYIRVRDPHTGNFTGQFESIFQVATNPGRPIIYGGCALVVLGTFLQFYMRAGVFTDGGKKERERALAKKNKKIAASAQPALEDL
jgi:hypothetical protein